MSQVNASTTSDAKSPDAEKRGSRRESVSSPKAKVKRSVSGAVVKPSGSRSSVLDDIETPFTTESDSLKLRVIQLENQLKSDKLAYETEIKEKDEVIKNLSKEVALLQKQQDNSELLKNPLNEVLFKLFQKVESLEFTLNEERSAQKAQEVRFRERTQLMEQQVQEFMKKERDRRNRQKSKQEELQKIETTRRMQKQRVCHFCQQVFTLETNHETSCLYHPGSFKLSGLSSNWSCCKNFKEHPGCVPRGQHIQ